MDSAKRGRIFDENSGEVVDVKKAPVIYRRNCDAPVCDPIVLALEQAMQQRGTVTAIGGKSDLDNAVRSVDCGQCLFQCRRLAIRWRAGIAIIICKRQKNAARVAGIAGMCHDNADDFRIALRIDRQLVLEIPGGEGAIRCVELERDLAGLQRVTVGPPEDRKQDPRVPPVWERIPVDVEDFGIRRFLTPFQNVEPPRVVGATDTHVIWDEIENESEVVLLERGGGRAKPSSPPSSGLSRS